MIDGYARCFAKVDLSTGRVEKTILEEDILRKYLGGKALGAYLLNRMLPAGTDPLSPENIVIFVTGPLTGTAYPASARAGIVTRSPLTGTFLDSYAGGDFGPRLKWAGYDGLIVVGRAKKPVYVVVDPAGIRIVDAEGLWGMDTLSAVNRLQGAESADGAKLSAAVIGPAGEKLCLFASVISDRRAFGRGGAGAVLGSKNLKAVVVRGRGRVPARYAALFERTVKEAREKIADNPVTGPKGSFPKIGTMTTLDLTDELGTLPGLNWRENHCGCADRIGAAAFEPLVRRARACRACPIACGRTIRAEWKGAVYETVGPEYETMYAFGPNLGIFDPEVVVAANRLCEEYGLDTISAGGVIGLAMECFEKGIIDRAQTGGRDLSFGSGDAALELIVETAMRRGFGALLADGARRFAGRFPQAEAMAMEVKGLELPGYDPRGMKGQSLTYALSDRGGCHLRSSTLGAELMGHPPGYDRLSYKNKAELIMRLQADKVVFNSAIECLFAGFALKVEDLAEAISALTGFGLEREDLNLVGRRGWNLSRLFNVRNGFGPEQDTLPRRLFEEASTAGPSKGEVVDRVEFERMKAEYYRLAGWDPRTGAPTPETLESLGIGTVLED